MRPARRGVALGATLAAALALAAGACSARPAAAPPLRLTASPLGPDTRLTLHADPHLKINARVPPALELAGGGVLRFRAGRLTPDSAYYAEAPSAILPGRHTGVHGTLRASVCRDDEQLCGSLSVEL